MIRDAKRALQLRAGAGDRLAAPWSSWRWRECVSRLTIRTACSTQKPRGAPASRPDKDQARLVLQVGFAFPPIAQRVLWRADCLVQALAGECWLCRFGIAAQVVIGVKKDGPAQLDAHAWL